MNAEHHHSPFSGENAAAADLSVGMASAVSAMADGEISSAELDALLSSLGADELPNWRVVVAATFGIWLLAGAAFAVNCLAEREIDARMARTARRPMAQGEISVTQTAIFSAVIGGLGSLL
eukprot:gene14703-31260_t